MKILENKHYIRIGDETVALDGEVKKTWDKAINNARNYARKTNACGQPNFRCCCGDCPMCPWYRNYRDSINISMDDKDPEWINRLSANPGKRSYMPAQEINDPADLIGERDAIDAVMKQAQRACEDGAQILQLMMENCSSYHFFRSNRPEHFRIHYPCYGGVFHWVLAERIGSDGTGDSGQPDWPAGNRELSSEAA